ncbi:hypothetical protein LU298_12595 [Komagataeibacter intermedius]|uniref:Uncharacterized protein n=3 Tax=Komagataeibacter intermedius TaxID=66229 RepID=A0A0N0ME78_9PROT|nr:hypothetical protein [Komagataeibacter intermedius]KPH86093.1 hypothetical protein GLUCOINTEAF2_0200945 [Komagataeibacter intermedius AF2]MCF3637333.1 hypothetical protein [Komagataeibacter intermedius]GAN87971.1 hypothetical protein Gain_0108_042 [Komagataeibacter intermedius TF2]GBQ75244.1 hypothetical protein AA0521_2608 [Komagataeibacter intermedius NRIC 0521]
MTPLPLRGMLVASACALGFVDLACPLRPAHAQQAEERHGPTDEQRAEIQRAVHEAIQQDIRKVAQYKLPRDFFARMLPLVRQIRRAGIIPPTQTANMTLVTTIRRTQAMPQLQPILQQHGMSAEDFVMSLTAFEMTNAMIQAPPRKTKDTPQLDKDNVRLIESHQALAQALVHDMDVETEHLQ